MVVFIKSNKVARCIQKVKNNRKNWALKGDNDFENQIAHVNLLHKK